MPNDNNQNTQNTNPPLAGVAPSIPPAQTLNQNSPDAKAPSESGINLPPVIVNPSTRIGGSFGGKKILATILGILVLVGGLGAGILLTKQSQDIREKAAIEQWCSVDSGGGCSFVAPGSACSEKETCEYIKEGENGSDGYGLCACTPISVATPTPAPVTTATCGPIEAYTVSGDPTSSSSTWTRISLDTSTDLEEGDVIYFAVDATYTTSVIDSAKFTINGVEQSAATAKASDCSKENTCVVEFYQKYTIPADVTSYTVTAKLHNSNTDTWF